MARELQSSIVSKCVEVMDHLSNSLDPMSFTEIVTATGFTKSSAHRIIGVLVNEGLVQFDADTKSYGLGPRPMRWARSAWHKIDLRQITDPELIHLRDETGLNVAVSVSTGDAVMFIRTFDVHSVRYAAKIGDQAPFHATAAGKVFLAHAEDQTNCGLPAGYDLEKLTEHTITTPRDLARDLKATRDRGYAICDREEFLQIRGIAAPVFDYQSCVVASIGLWAHTRTSDLPEIERHAGALLRLTAEISNRFGSMTT